LDVLLLWPNLGFLEPLGCQFGAPTSKGHSCPKDAKTDHQSDPKMTLRSPKARHKTHSETHVDFVTVWVAQIGALGEHLGANFAPACDLGTGI
jgi:hypothetical protein